MYKIISIVLISSLSICVSASNITIPEQFIVLKVDNQAHSSGYFSTGAKLELAAGKHSLRLKYEDFFENDDDDNRTKVSSEPFVVQFTVEDGQDISISSGSIKNIDQATVFAKDPQVTLIIGPNNQLSEVSHKQNATSIQKLTISTPVTIDTTNQPTDVRASTLSQLKSLWNQATKQEKQQFMEFMISQ